MKSRRFSASYSHEMYVKLKEKKILVQIIKRDIHVEILPFLLFKQLRLIFYFA